MGKASRKKKSDKHKQPAQRTASEALPGAKAVALNRYALAVVFLILAAATFVIYSQTFHFPLIFDDSIYIEKNLSVRNLSNFWPPAGTRYIGYLSFALNYHFGGLNPFGYHLVNVLIHAVNASIVFCLALLTFRTPVMRRYGAPSAAGLAIAASLLFLAHPVQTQAVTYITQRFASLATLFYLLSLLLYLSARLLRVKEGEDAAKARPPSIAAYILSILVAALAMKTKEISFTLPVVIVLYELVFFREPEGSPGRYGRLWYIVPFVLVMGIIPLELFGPEYGLWGSEAVVGEHIRSMQMGELVSISQHDYLVTQFRVIVTYLRLLILPINQSLDYGYPFFNSIFKPQVLVSFLFLAALFAFALYLHRQSRRRQNGYLLIIAIGILWFFIALSVESSLVPIQDALFEHRLYLPSFGAFLAFSAAAFYGFDYLKVRFDIKASSSAFTVLLIFVTAMPLGVASFVRNGVWSDELILWENSVRHRPESARGRLNLGHAYKDKGLVKEAIEQFAISVALKPTYAAPYNSMGISYAELGNNEKAKELYLKALKLMPGYVEARSNLGIIYINLGLMDEALEQFNIVLKQKPNHLDALNNRGNLYQTLGRNDEAVKDYRNLLRLRPDYVEAHFNLGNTYSGMGRADEALKEYRLALKYRPGYSPAYSNIGNVYHVLGRLDEAIEAYKQAMKLDSKNKEAHFNLGATYFRRGQLDEAEREFKAAFRLDPDYMKDMAAIRMVKKRRREKSGP